jgi:hypothetical protein
MPVQRRNILRKETEQIGPAGAMKAGAESKGAPLSAEYVAAMVQADHIRLEIRPVVNFGERLVF